MSITFVHADLEYCREQVVISKLVQNENVRYSWHWTNDIRLVLEFEELPVITANTYNLWAHINFNYSDSSISHWI
jgi:hypothetical protein